MMTAALVALYALGAVVFLCAIMLAGVAATNSPHPALKPAWTRIVIATICWPLAAIAILFIVLAKVSRA